MQVKTILNRVHNFKSFVYGAAHWVEESSAPSLEIEIRPRADSGPRCGGCGRHRAGYDRLARQRFEFIPLWGRHRPLLLNRFRAKKQLSSAVVEGFNTKAKLATRKSYGFKTYHVLKKSRYIMHLEHCRPKMSHEFF